MAEMSPATEKSDHDRWLGVEVRHLAALRAVAEEGTFGAAALKLGYAQSAISQQIAALERHVGRRLFDRPGGSRPVTLTRSGELLLGHAESIMSRLSAARIDLESLTDEDTGGALRVGAYQSVAAAILPLILREIGTGPEEAVVELTESNDDGHLLDLLERGELDIAFTTLPVADGPLETTPLLSDPYLLLVHEEHPYAELDRELTLEEVAAVPLIACKRSPSQASVEDIFVYHGLNPRFAQRVEDNATLHSFVVAGLGCGLVPRLAVSIDGKPLVALSIEPKLPERIIAIAWHRDRLRTCTAGLFVDLAVEVSTQLEGALRPAFN
jgi:DNA-binding transcriptional LysR family regulator